MLFIFFFTIYIYAFIIHLYTFYYKHTFIRKIATIKKNNFLKEITTTSNTTADKK